MLRAFFLGSLVFFSVQSMASGIGTGSKARVEVTCSRSSAFVHVNINSYRPIGKVTIEVKDDKGLTLYKEEGKALTPELVRRLDKGGFPRGTHALVVSAKDFTITRPFTVE